MREWSITPNPDVPYEVRYRDEHLLVADKPSGVVTEPGKGHADDSLLNGLFGEFAAALQNLGEGRDWGLLHRLDKDTSGLLLVGLRVKAYDALRAAFEARQVKKVYWALVMGTPQPAQAVLQKPIVEVTGVRKRASLRQEGRQAITAYKVLQRGDRVSLVEARPATGRLHQIRVHMASIGCPVLGDEMYGASARAIRVPRLCLHAARLSFVHPEKQRRIEVASMWPADLDATLKRFGFEKPGVSP